MFIRDLDNNEYPLDAVVNHEIDLKGNERLELDIHYTINNKHFLKQNSDLKMWLIHFDNKDYIIFQSKIKTHGNKHYVSVTARLYILDWLASHRLYKKIDASLTTTEAFNHVFEGSPFTYVIIDSVHSKSFEGLGDGDTKLSVFQKLIDRYGYEVNIVDNVVYLELLKGNDANFEYRYQLNASNIEKDIDASALYTYIKGYGDYDDQESEIPVEEKANLIPEPYVSPLAEILGVREAPPIKDGRITHESTMLEAMQKVVDESVQITFTADILNMAQQGYDYQHTMVGDRVFLVDERIDLDKEIRVSKIKRTFNVEGLLTSMNVTFGGQSVSDAYSQSTNQAITDIQDLIKGRKQLPFPALDIVSQSMVSKIKATTSEVEYDANGQHFIEKSNPNHIMTLNSSGLLLSTDGGRTAETAMTAEGMTANAITAGTLNANLVTVTGGHKNRNVTIQNDELRLNGTYTRMWRGKESTANVFTSMKDGYLRFRNNDLSRSLYMSEFGISTYMDQTGEYVDAPGNSSGTIAWWDKTYSPSGANGITINSYGGVAALTSNKNRVMVQGGRSVNLESTNSNIYIRPDISQLGLNTFSFNIASNRQYKDGYIMFGDHDNNAYASGVRFSRADARLEIVDTDYSTGGDTTIEAGFGSFNTVSRRPGNHHLNIVHPDVFKVGADKSGDRVASKTIYNRGYEDGVANVYITPYGTLGRATSASKYKISIENQFKNEQEQIEHSSRILNLDVKSWFGKWKAETLAKEIETGERLSDEDFELKRTVGLVAEDVEEAGLSEFVSYGADGDVEGIGYDRLWIHLIPVIKDQQKRIEKLEATINGK